MRKYIFLLKNYLEVNKKFFLFIFIIFLIGIASGSVFTLTLNDSDCSIISEFLSNYLENLSNNLINYKDAFINSITSNFLIVSFIWLLGFSIIGIPIIILILFYKSFIIGFSLASIIINYKIKGLLISILYVFPHQVCFILVLMSLVVYSIIISLSLFKSIFKGEEINFNIFTKKYNIILLITLFLSFICSLYESFILPFIINIAI